ncbi:hypothetical protein L227DRAFT_640548 [Lentinus tigrinus ALCF2SS1-6]|uniref:Cytochrome b5 heme-binding domain-containing protein n=1 Tax=Lentinus tigrinus ALCF2SS1-6 TaxID=1328759 RepID=A0A5C2SIZ3_9APHY|nr:hypothetical protein L227DRAFT_640548 [Lentinus tigrinus ALCF2SS1-6]
MALRGTYLWSYLFTSLATCSPPQLHQVVAPTDQMHDPTRSDRALKKEDLGILVYHREQLRPSLRPYVLGSCALRPDLHSPYPLRSPWPLRSWWLERQLRRAARICTNKAWNPAELALFDAQNVKSKQWWAKKFSQDQHSNGTIHTDTPFSRLLGKLPIVVAGMTPTTVKAGFSKIVNFNIEGQQYVCAGELILNLNLLRLTSLGYIFGRCLKLTKKSTVDQVKEMLGEIVSSLHGSFGPSLSRGIDVQPHSCYPWADVMPLRAYALLMFYHIIFGRLTIAARCIAIMNHADPELVTYMQYYIDQWDSECDEANMPEGRQTASPCTRMVVVRKLDAYVKEVASGDTIGTPTNVQKIQDHILMLWDCTALSPLQIYLPAAFGTMFKDQNALLTDVEALVNHMHSTLSLDLDYILPFSLSPKTADGLNDKSEFAHHIMLVNLLRFLGIVKNERANCHFVTHPTQVIPLLSPNHGLFGNGGLCSESKISLERLCNHCNSENRGEYLGTVVGWTVEQARDERTFDVLHLMHMLLFSIMQVELICAELSGSMDRFPDLADITTRIRTDLMKKCENFVVRSLATALWTSRANRIEGERVLQALEDVLRASEKESKRDGDDESVLPDDATEFTHQESLAQVYTTVARRRGLGFLVGQEGWGRYSSRRRSMLASKEGGIVAKAPNPVEDSEVPTSGSVDRPGIQLVCREKVTIFWLIFLSNCILAGANQNFWVMIQGTVYNVSNFIHGQHSDVDDLKSNTDNLLEEVAGQDLTEYFPPPIRFACQGLVSTALTVQLTPANETTIMIHPCQFRKGLLVWRKDQVRAAASDPDNRRLWAICDNQHLQSLGRHLHCYQVNYLNLDIVDLFQQQPGQNITKLLNQGNQGFAPIFNSGSTNTSSTYRPITANKLYRQLQGLTEGPNSRYCPCRSSPFRSRTLNATPRLLDEIGAAYSRSPRASTRRTRSTEKVGYPVLVCRSYIPGVQQGVLNKLPLQAMAVSLHREDNDIKVIERNLRAVRSFPFVSKVTGIDAIEMVTKLCHVSYVVCFTMAYSPTYGISSQPGLKGYANTFLCLCLAGKEPRHWMSISLASMQTDAFSFDGESVISEPEVSTSSNDDLTDWIRQEDDEIAEELLNLTKRVHALEASLQELVREWIDANSRFAAFLDFKGGESQ